MALTPGLYTFTCGECDGTGEIEVGDAEYGDAHTIDCEDCHGTGQIEVDEDDAEALIEDGADPISGP